MFSFFPNKVKLETSFKDMDSCPGKFPMEVKGSHMFIPICIHMFMFMQSRMHLVYSLWHRLLCVPYLYVYVDVEMS